MGGSGSQQAVGQADFDTLSTKAQFQGKLGKESEEKATMTLALNQPGTTALQIHLYARQLLAAHRNVEAMAIFQLNAKRNGDA